MDNTVFDNADRRINTTLCVAPACRILKSGVLAGDAHVEWWREVSSGCGGGFLRTQELQSVVGAYRSKSLWRNGWNTRGLVLTRSCTTPASLLMATLQEAMKMSASSVSKLRPYLDPHHLVDFDIPASESVQGEK